MESPSARLGVHPGEALLLVVDMQERLAAAMPPAALDAAVRNAVRLVEGARLLGIPVAVTEQYPRGLGPTVAPIREAMAASTVAVIEKIEFDATACSGVKTVLDAHPARRQIILCGMEAHICVWQTALGLLDAGYRVHVPFDATCSRDLENRRIAEDLWRSAGAVVTNTETVLFHALGKAEGDAFKAISKLVR